MGSVELTLIILSAVLATLLLIALIIILIIRRKYKLNWFQQTLLESSIEETTSSKPHIVKHQIVSHGAQDSSSEEDEEEGGIDNEGMSDEKCSLISHTALTDLSESQANTPSLLAKLSKHVNFIQPVVHHHSVRRDSAMGSEESKLITTKSILKQKCTPTNRRFSAPVIYGKTGTETTPHTKLTATHSVPYTASGTPLLSTEESDASQFTLPFDPSEEFQSPTSKARLARRRTSMQDSIDATQFDPELYKSLERTPTIREEPSVDMTEPIGIIYLTVLLTSDTALLKVIIHKADLTGFPTSQVTLRRPYFHVCVIGSNSPARHTKPSDDSLHPEIEETFLFEVGDELAGKRLVCHLYDYDQFVRTDKIGYMQLRLNTIPHNEPMSIQKHIDRCEAEHHIHDEKYVGEILFSINYSKVTERLTLVIVKAKDLHIEDELAVLGLMVKVTILLQGRRIKKKRTENVKLSTNPSWNEALTLNISPKQLPDISITVDVCKDKLNGSEVIGRVYVGEHGDVKGAEHWREVQDSANQNGSLEWWHQLKRVDKVT